MDGEVAKYVPELFATYWALIPPLVAIILALITKEVYSSLFIGIVMGGVLYSISSGFDVELAQKVCDKLGWVLKVQPIHSEDAYIELNSGNIDCAWGGVVLDKECPDYTILVTYMSTDLVLAGKSSSGGSVRGKVLYMGTTQYCLDVMEDSGSVSRKLGQITRVQGGTTDYFNALDNGKCDLILTTEAAVEYYNTN